MVMGSGSAGPDRKPSDRLLEARHAAEQAVKAAESAFGAGHPSVAKALSILASLYFQEGQPAEAETIYQRVLSIRERALGMSDASVAETLGNLGELYAACRDFEKAQTFYKRALRIQERISGVQSRDLAPFIEKLVELYAHQGNTEDAQFWQDRLKGLRETSFGAHASASKESQSLPGIKRDSYQQSEVTFKHSLRQLEERLGPNHPDLAKFLATAAGLYLAQGRDKESETLYQRAISICRQIERPTPELIALLESYVALLERLGRQDEANERKEEIKKMGKLSYKPPITPKVKDDDSPSAQ